MRYDPALDFYTQEDVDRLKVLDVETDDAGLLGDLRTYTAKMLEARSIFEAIDLRYVESRKGNDKLILEDVNHILAQAQKEDFKEFLLTIATPIRDNNPIEVENLKNDTIRDRVKAADEKRAQEAADQDNYRGCLEFFQSWLRLPIAAALYSYDDKDKKEKLYKKIIALLDQRVREWYPKEEKAYLSVYNGKPLSAITYLNPSKHEKNRDKISKVTTYEVDGVEIATRAVLKSGVNVAKTFLFLVAEFTEQNTFDKNTGVVVSASLSDYARYCGKDMVRHPTSTPEEEAAEVKRVKNVRDNLVKELKKSLDILRDIRYTRDDDKVYGFVHLLAEGWIKGDTITAAFPPSLAVHLSQQSRTITQIPTAIFKIPATDPNSLYLMYKLTSHYNLDRNIQRGTNNFIGVKSLLAVADLPSFEEVQKKDRGHWERRIKEPFEEILERLVSKYGYLSSWEYRHEKKQAVTDEDLAELTDFKEWRDHYYILFEPVKKIDHAERLERKSERIEKKKKSRKKS